MRARIWLIFFWITVSGVAAAALFWTWKHPPRIALTPAAPSTSAALAPAADAFAPSPLAHYVEIVERPLFIDARRPQPDEAVETAPLPTTVAPAQAPLPPLRLVGVVLLPNRAAALLRPEEPEPDAPKPASRLPLNRAKAPPRKPQATAKVLRLPQGGMLDGWLLETVQPERVIFRRNHEVQELSLLRPITPPRPPPPAESANANHKPVPPPKTARANAPPTPVAAPAHKAPSTAPPVVTAPEASAAPAANAIAPPESVPAADTVIVAPPSTDTSAAESTTGL